jgi:hypothetical protein
MSDLEREVAELEQNVSEKAADILARVCKLVGQYGDMLLRDVHVPPAMLVNAYLVQAVRLFLQDNPLADERAAVAYLTHRLNEYAASVEPRDGPLQ